MERDEENMHCSIILALFIKINWILNDDEKRLKFFVNIFQGFILGLIGCKNKKDSVNKNSS